MDVWYFVQIAAAVTVANAACFAFFMAAMAASKAQKEGAEDSEFSAWVYAGLIAAPALVAWGGLLLR